MPADTYGSVVNSPVGRFVARRAGLPRPVELERHSPGDPVVRGRVLLGAAPGAGRAGGGGGEGGARGGGGAGGGGDPGAPRGGRVRRAAGGARLDAAVFNPDAP